MGVDGATREVSALTNRQLFIAGFGWFARKNGLASVQRERTITRGGNLGVHSGMHPMHRNPSLLLHGAAEHVTKAGVERCGGSSKSES